MTGERGQDKPGAEGANPLGDVDTFQAQPPEQWRSATLNVLGALAVVGGTGLLIVSFLTTKGSAWIVASSLGILIGVAVMIRRQRLSLRVRGGLLTLAFLIISALSTQLLGPVPAAILLVTAAAVVARLFVGARAALVATVLGSINFLAVGIAYRADTAARLGGELLRIAPWARMAGATGLLTTIIVLTLGRTLNRLEASLAEARLALARAAEQQQARERAEAGRHESEAQLRLTLEAASVATWSMDPTTKAVTWSENLSRVLGLPETSLPTTVDDVLGLVHPDDRVRAAERLARGVADTADPIELRLLRPDGRLLWAESRSRRVPGPAGDRLLGVIVDVTERRRAEDTLRKHDAAVEASRVKSDFVANMSHEIRTPLNAVLGFAHLALRTDLSDQQRGYLNGIAGASQALLAVINAVLDLSKIEAGKLIFAVLPFTLADLRTRVESVLAVQAQQKGIALRFDIAADVPPVLEGDLTRLSQVLINLGSNGIKFSEQGPVDITIACVNRDQDGAALRFTVHDTGIGMTPAQVSKLFEPFTQATAATAQQYGGTGLGLTISKRIVEQLGGGIDVDSAPAKGTTVTFTLRLRTTTAVVGAAVDRTRARQNSLAGVRVLVADDVEINRQIAREILQSAGATVDFAVDGAAAVRAVVSAGAPYDVVLMDVQMPVMDGLEATRRIRAGAVGAAVPIVALSAHAFETEKRKCLDAGMTAYLAKPMEPAELIALLGRLALFPSAAET